MQPTNDISTYKRIRVSLTEKDQLTLPADVKRYLGTKRRGKVEFVFEKGRVYIEPVKYSLEDVFMSVKPIRLVKDFKSVEEEAHEEHVEELMAKYNKQGG